MVGVQLLSGANSVKTQLGVPQDLRESTVLLTGLRPTIRSERLGEEASPHKQQRKPGMVFSAEIAN